MAQIVKQLPTMRETWVRSLGREDPLKKEMASHSSILAGKIPWTEDSGRLQFMGNIGKNYTKKKKGFNGLDNHDGMFTQRESDILECEVKRALASIAINKDSRSDRIPRRCCC